MKWFEILQITADIEVMQVTLKTNTPCAPLQGMNTFQ